MATAAKWIFRTISPLALLIVIFFTYLSLSHARDDVLVINPIQVPESFGEVGLNSDTASLWIAGEIARIQEAVDSETTLSDENDRPVRSEIDSLNLIFPGTKIEYQQISRSLESLGWIELDRVSGSIICSDIDCSSGNVYAQIIIGNGAKTADGDPPTLLNLSISPPQGINNLMTEIALRVILAIRPLIATSYIYTNGNTEWAENELRNLLSPKNPHRSGAMHQLAILSSNKGNYEESLAYFEFALEDATQDKLSIITSDKGWTLVRLGQHEKAIKMFTDALSTNPNNTAALTNWGVALRRKGDLKGAIAKYLEAFLIRPDYSENLSNWGVALRSLKDFSGASECYRMATEANPINWRAFNNWGFSLRAAAENASQEERGRFLTASINKYERAIELRGDYAVAFHNMGRALRDLGRYAEAFEAYHRAIEIRPDYRQALVAWGIGLREDGRLEESADKLTQAREVAPEYARAYFHSALTAEKLGKSTEAAQFIRTAESIEPTNGDIIGARRRIVDKVKETRSAVDNEEEVQQSIGKETYAQCYLSHPGR